MGWGTFIKLITVFGNTARLALTFGKCLHELLKLRVLLHFRQKFLHVEVVILLRGRTFPWSPSLDGATR